MNKVLIPSVTLAALLIIGAIRASDISAHPSGTMYDTLVSRIAAEFDLSEDDVQAVVDAVHDEQHFEYMHSMHEQRDRGHARMHEFMTKIQDE